MKYNLKNRPRPTGYAVRKQPYVRQKAYEEWFEGFEKQEKQKELELRTMPEANIQHLRDKVRAYEKHIKGILGE